MKRAFALLIALAGIAQAEPASLQLTHEPPPRHLRMRPRRTAAASSAVPAPDSTADIKAPETIEPTLSTAKEALPLGSVRDLRRPISIRFNLGYAVDGTNLSGRPNMNEQEVHAEEFARLRAYALGEGYWSSRGVFLPSLSTYFAAHFQIAQPSTGFNHLDPQQTPLVVGPPVATWFERSGVEPRAAWAEVKDFLPDPRLAPLRLRGGELYVYGPWVMHMYGALAGWEGKLVRATIYGGSRVPDYTNGGVLDRKDRAGIFGNSATFDLRALKTPVPFTIGIELLRFTATGADDKQATSHGALQLDWRPRKDVALISRFRVLDGEIANEHVQLRSRYKQVTNLVFDFTHRHARDWRWDPSVGNTDILEAKRYLDLGPVVPQSLISGRAGTLIKENLDLLVRGAFAWDQPASEQDRNTFTAGYVELGTALEMRLRRTIGLGLSGMTRQTKRTATVPGEIPDIPNVIDPLPRQFGSELGESGFTEVGATLRMSLGARRLSALVELYGRRTRYALDYCAAKVIDGTVDPNCMSALDTGLLTQDTRGGGRFTLDAWVGSQLRLFASYEISSQLDLQREISGFKSLRLMMEGIY